jgi:hypothetical protein
MDLLWTLLLALPTIFLAAFLAAVVENWRERRRTRRWVMRNLHEIVGEARFDSMAPLQESLRRWLAASSTEDMTDDDWRQVWFVSFSNAPDLSPLLRSEAATAVSGELFRALNTLDTEVHSVKLAEAYLNDYFKTEIAPLWYERRVPLPDADRRRVERFRGLVQVMAEAADRTRGAFDDLRAIVSIKELPKPDPRRSG